MSVAETNNPHIGFKKLDCGWIAKLLILGDNNEDRDTVKYAEYAKHRCSAAKVLDIYKWDDKNAKASVGFTILSTLSHKLKYTVGEIITPDDYDRNKNNICSNGIHYFLSEECAIVWDLSEKSFAENQEFCTWREWYPDGQPAQNNMYKNGLLNGPSICWQEDGDVRSIRTYKNGRLHGPTIVFENGFISSYDEYENGERCGLDVEYQKNGQINTMAHYYKNNQVGKFYSARANGKLESEYDNDNTPVKMFNGIIIGVVGLTGIITAGVLARFGIRF